LCPGSAYRIALGPRTGQKHVARKESNVFRENIRTWFNIATAEQRSPEYAALLPGYTAVPLHHPPRERLKRDGAGDRSSRTKFLVEFGVPSITPRARQ